MKKKGMEIREEMYETGKPYYIQYADLEVGS